MSQEREKTGAPLSLDIIYALALTRLESQLREVEAIDTKLSQILAASSVVIGLAAGFFASRQDTLPPITLKLSAINIAIPALPFDLLVISGFIYFAIVVISVLAYRFLGLRYLPVKAAWEEALYWEPTITKQQILAELVQATEYNKPLIAQKVTRATIVLWLLPAEVLFSLLALGGLYLRLGGG